MKKIIQVAIIASTGLMFIQTSANAQAWKHCAQNVADRYQQCVSRRGTNCEQEVDRGWANCERNLSGNKTGRFQEQYPTFEEFVNWIYSRYGGRTSPDEVR